MKRFTLLLVIPAAFMLQSCFEPTVSPGAGGSYGAGYGGGHSRAASTDRSATKTIQKVRGMSGQSLRRGY